MRFFLFSLLTAVATLAVDLPNASFENWGEGKPTPSGWGLYAGGGEGQALTPVAPEFGEGKAVLLADPDEGREIGLFADVAIKGGETYMATVKVAAVKGRPRPRNFYLQMRFLPSNKFQQTTIFSNSDKTYRDISVFGTAPEGDKKVRLYIYTHRGTPTWAIVDEVRLFSGVEVPAEFQPPPPKKAPQYTKLKKQYLQTPLAEAAIVAPPEYAQSAKEIQDAVFTVCGKRIPIRAEANLPLKEHLVLLGNRSTNAVIGKLYEKYYTLLDLKYPGAGGHVVRSLHNPYGTGKNAIFAGGSDGAGVAAAATALADKIRQAKGGVLGWILAVKLGEGMVPPSDVSSNAPTWEASAGYGSTGYFGWSSLAKRLALYYMTGDESHAREFIRLSFPDAQAKKEISDIDGERIENKDDPLAGAYHYNQHMVTLFWDLTEESPVFSDEERLAVTNAIARQLDHPDYAREGVYRLTRPADQVSSRHGQWAAIGLYCLGRYFRNSYPDPVWDHTFRAANLAFASLHQHALVAGESDNLYWYSTGIAPIFTYLCLSGDREPVENGVIATLLKAQEALFTGLRSDRRIRYASLGFLHKAAHITGDGRWLFYRNRTGMDTNEFRLGQSYWPREDFQPVPPTDLCGKWNVSFLPEELWRRRGSGIALEHSFNFASYRNEVEAGGDFLLLDGFNGASRNPYHTFAILDLRIDGTPLLKGYLNQVLSKADGMVEPQVAMDAGLLQHDVVGQTVYAHGQVPRAAFCDWQRHILQRVGKYALVVDDLTFREDSQNMSLETLWETVGGKWDRKRRAIVFPPPIPSKKGAGWQEIKLHELKWRSNPDTPGMTKALGSLEIMLLRAAAPGPWMECDFELKSDFRGELSLDTVKYGDRGLIDVQLDGKTVLSKANLESAGVARETFSLGKATLAAGTHTLRVIAAGLTPAGIRNYAGIGKLTLKAEGAKEPVATATKLWELSPSEVLDVSGSGRVRMQWRGAVRAGEHGVFFHLLASAPNAASTDNCVRLSERSAFLRLPEPAVATLGEDGSFSILSESHLTLRTGKAPLGLIASDQTLDVDWDFTEGTLAICCGQPAVVTIPTTAGVRTHNLTAGPHVFNNYIPTAEARAKLGGELASAAGKAAQLRRVALEAKASAKLLPDDLAELKVSKVTAFPEAVTEVISIPGVGDTLYCAAAGKAVRLFRADGSVVRDWKTTGIVRNLHWWPEPKLLLVGCRDEKLLAYDCGGNLQWTFVSEMDPAVFRAAKTYWFKSAPGHEGIHGLYTGNFIDGKSQCFVGGACTLEIVNSNGSLAKRLPVFWGPGKLFELVDRADGSRDLLIARYPNGSDSLSIVNSKTLKVRRGFYGVPSGQNMVGGWSANNRVRLINTDLDGDGKPEVVAPVNGRWNRLTVFSDTGTPLFCAQLGPGESSRFRNFFRDVDTGDVTGDGKQEIFLGEWGGLTVAFNHKCERLWSRRLPMPPRVLRVLKGTDKTLAVGCDGGQLVLLDKVGVPQATGRVGQTPVQLLPLPDGAFLVADRKGTISLVRP